ncbi:MAG: Rne/Rng family ribonuclease [Cardiobacteriaceae bacterium]|nr:Rne/Rng family ribonuclease [Cardiobacteriaceae bacterium]
MNNFPLLLAYKPVTVKPSIEILVNHTLYETRVAILENGILQDLMLERQRRRGLVGNIYKGKVQRVLPGMDAAFIDIGIERAGFLHLKNIVLNSEGRELHIQDILHEGQIIMVQVIKDPIGTKGARLTTEISIPSRFLVFLPNSNDIGVSVKISCEEQRNELRSLLIDFHKGRQGGFIVRTAINSAGIWAMRADMQYLYRVWENILINYQIAKPGTLVYRDLPLYKKVLRDFVSPEVAKVYVDDEQTFEEMAEFDSNFLLEMEGRLELYEGDTPIFERYGINKEIEKALNKRVNLKSGGYLIIEQTEAMATIDVNTGGFVGKHSQEDTIFKTNLEAAKAIAWQLRLRNLGGMIMVDFIDMVDENHRQVVVDCLAQALWKDKAKYTISSITPLGIVEMTRKRTRESLRHTLCEPCPTCKGHGYIKTAETQVYDLFRELIHETREYRPKQIAIVAHPKLIEYIREEESVTFSDLQILIKTPISLQAVAEYDEGQYEIIFN